MQLKSLKQVNVSKDAEKTKQRFKEDFSAASAQVKRAIIELSGQTRTSVYRIYNTGVINPRVALATAQELKVSPYYYTGEIDEKAPCNDRLLRAFAEHHYHSKPAAKQAEPAAKKVAAAPKKRAKKAAAPPAEKPDEAPALPKTQETAPEQQGEVAAAPPDEPVQDFEFSLSCSEEMQQAIAALDTESAVLLLKSLFIRAEAGGMAEHLADIVKRCLLS